MGALLAVLLSAGAARAQGGPPMITDDPGTPGAGDWEINIAVSLQRRPGAYAAQLPLVDLNYGLGDSLQLKYETAFQLTEVEGKGSGRLLGNSNFGVKWRFLDQERAGVSVSVYPQFIFNPVTRREVGLVEREPILFLPVEVGREWGRLRAAVEFGYAAAFAGADDALIYGLVAGLVVGRVLLVGDLHGDADLRLRSDELALLLGLVAPTETKVQLLASVGRTLRYGTLGPATLAFLGVRLNL